MIAWNNVLHLEELKPTKKNWGAKQAKIGTKIRFFTIFSSVIY